MKHGVTGKEWEPAKGMVCNGYLLAMAWMNHQNGQWESISGAAQSFLTCPKDLTIFDQPSATNYEPKRERSKGQRSQRSSISQIRPLHRIDTSQACVFPDSDDAATDAATFYIQLLLNGLGTYKQP